MNKDKILSKEEVLNGYIPATVRNILDDGEIIINYSTALKAMDEWADIKFNTAVDECIEVVEEHKNHKTHPPSSRLTIIKSIIYKFEQLKKQTAKQ